MSTCCLTKVHISRSILRRGSIFWSLIYFHHKSSFNLKSPLNRQQQILEMFYTLKVNIYQPINFTGANFHLVFVLLEIWVDLFQLDFLMLTLLKFMLAIYYLEQNKLICFYVLNLSILSNFNLKLFRIWDIPFKINPVKFDNILSNTT